MPEIYKIWKIKQGQIRLTILFFRSQASFIQGVNSVSGT
jgi:hypothetical protein